MTALKGWYLAKILSSVTISGSGQRVVCWLVQSRDWVWAIAGMAAARKRKERRARRGRTCDSWRGIGEIVQHWRVGRAGNGLDYKCGGLFSEVALTRARLHSLQIRT